MADRLPGEIIELIATQVFDSDDEREHAERIRDVASLALVNSTWRVPAFEQLCRRSWLHFVDENIYTRYMTHPEGVAVLERTSTLSVSLQGNSGQPPSPAAPIQLWALTDKDDTDIDFDKLLDTARQLWVLEIDAIKNLRLAALPSGPFYTTRELTLQCNCQGESLADSFKLVQSMPSLVSLRLLEMPDTIAIPDAPARLANLRRLEIHPRSADVDFAGGRTVVRTQAPAFLVSDLFSIETLDRVRELETCLPHWLLSDPAAKAVFEDRVELFVVRSEYPRRRADMELFTHFRSLKRLELHESDMLCETFEPERAPRSLYYALRFLPQSVKEVSLLRGRSNDDRLTLDWDSTSINAHTLKGKAVKKVVLCCKAPLQVRLDETPAPSPFRDYADTVAKLKRLGVELRLIPV